MCNFFEYRYVSEEIGVLACEGGPDEVVSCESGEVSSIMDSQD